MLQYSFLLNFIIHNLLVVFFEQRNYNVACGGMRYGLYDIERGKREMGRDPSVDKLLLRCGTHPRRYESGDNLADSQNFEKADWWSDKKGKGDKHEKNTAGWGWPQYSVLPHYIYENEGYLVDSANGQQTALQQIAQEQYDIILLDISLNDGNGFSICSAIKSQKDIPIIFLTADDDEFSVVSGLELGADDYICKPFRPRELLARINTVLRRKMEKVNFYLVKILQLMFKRRLSEKEIQSYSFRH